jgi:hypothetical protein
VFAKNLAVVYCITECYLFVRYLCVCQGSCYLLPLTGNLCVCQRSGHCLLHHQMLSFCPISLCLPRIMLLPIASPKVIFCLIRNFGFRQGSSHYLFCITECYIFCLIGNLGVCQGSSHCLLHHRMLSFCLI